MTTDEEKWDALLEAESVKFSNVSVRVRTLQTFMDQAMGVAESVGHAHVTVRVEEIPGPVVGEQAKTTLSISPAIKVRLFSDHLAQEELESDDDDELESDVELFDESPPQKIAKTNLEEVVGYLGDTMRDLHRSMLDDARAKKDDHQELVSVVLVNSDGSEFPVYNRIDYGDGDSRESAWEVFVDCKAALNDGEQVEFRVSDLTHSELVRGRTLGPAELVVVEEGAKAKKEKADQQP